MSTSYACAFPTPELMFSPRPIQNVIPNTSHSSHSQSLIGSSARDALSHFKSDDVLVPLKRDDIGTNSGIVSSSQLSVEDSSSKKPSGYSRVALYRGSVLMPVPLEIDRKERKLAMKKQAKTLQESKDSTFVYMVMNSTGIYLYNRMGDSQPLHKFTYDQIDMIKLSKRDKTFFYFSASSNSPSAEQTGKCSNMVHAFHATNNIIANRIVKITKFILEQKQSNKGFLQLSLDKFVEPSTSSSSIDDSCIDVSSSQADEPIMFNTHLLANRKTPTKCVNFAPESKTSSSSDDLLVSFDAEVTSSQVSANDDWATSDLSSLLNPNLVPEPSELQLDPVAENKVSSSNVACSMAMNNPFVSNPVASLQPLLPSVVQQHNPFLVPNQLPYLPTRGSANIKPVINSMYQASSFHPHVQNPCAQSVFRPSVTNKMQSNAQKHATAGQTLFDSNFDAFLSQTVKSELSQHKAA